jgi:hypothetical protein
MADVKISGLPASTVPLAGTEVLPIVQGATTKQVSIANVTAGRAIAALSITSDTYKAASSSGGALQNTSGVSQFQWGAGGNSNVTIPVATTISPANAAVIISPTGSGTVDISPVGALTINPTTASTINNASIGVSTAAAGAFTTLSASSTVSGTGFSTYLASPPAIGGTAPAAGAFNSLSSTLANGGFTTYADGVAGDEVFFGAYKSIFGSGNPSDGAIYTGKAGSSVTISARSGGVILTAGATSWAAVSDERVKENLVPVVDALKKVDSLRSVIGNYIWDEDKKARPFLIAQDLLAAFPEAVDANNPDNLSVRYSEVIPLLVAAIKELNANFEAYKATHP